MVITAFITMNKFTGFIPPSIEKEPADFNFSGLQSARSSTQDIPVLRGLPKIRITRGIISWHQTIDTKLFVDLFICPSPINSFGLKGDNNIH